MANTRYYSDVESIFFKAIARRNQNDPDSNSGTALTYINDFYALTMGDDVKLFERFSTLTFEIDETTEDGVYNFTEVGLDEDGEFINISGEAFITLTDPPQGSVSWNDLEIYQDPGRFYAYWGINNEDILIRGMPTEMLYYGNQFVIRTLPNTAYTVKIYGYKANLGFPGDANDAESEENTLPFSYWMRYIAYGAALDYARDFKFTSEAKAQIQADFNHEKTKLLKRTHNQIKMSRAYPRF